MAVGLEPEGDGCASCAGRVPGTRSSSVSSRTESLRRQRTGIMLIPPGSSGDVLLVRGLPAPCAGAVAALCHPHPVDFGDYFAVAGEKRLGRAHLGAERQLALGQTVAAVFAVFLFRRIGFGAAGAEGAFVHLAAAAEIADLRILRRAERTGVEAVAAADAQVLGMQHHAVVGLVEAVDRTDCGAGCIGAVHAGHGYRTLARLAVIQRDDAAAVDAPGHVMLVLAGGDAGVAFDAAIGVAKEFHTGHRSLLRLRPVVSGRASPWSRACWSPGRSRRS